jgi:hypothetical protein
MILATVLAATKPWTHWIAPPLLAAEIVFLVGLGIRYYHKVQVPWYLWRLRHRQHH